MSRTPTLALVTAALLSASCSGRSPPESAEPPDLDGVAGQSSSANAGPLELKSIVARAESIYWRTEFDSAREVLQLALPVAEQRGDTATLARILTWLGLVAWQQSNYSQARQLGERALALKLQAGLEGDLFRSYNALGLLAWHEGRSPDAIRMFEKAADAARATADTGGLASVTSNTAMVHLDLGNFVQARNGLVQARDAFRRLGDAMRQGRVLSNLAMLDVQMGDPGSAVTSLAEGLLLLRAAEDRNGEQNALGQLGTAYQALGEPQLALAALDSALFLARQHGLRQEEASNLELIAGLYREAGDLQRALRIYQQANQLNQELGLPLEQGNSLRNTAEVQAALGRPDLAREHAREALQLHRSNGLPLHELRDLLLLADLAALESRVQEVASYLDAADRLSVRLDARVARTEVALGRAGAADRLGDSRSVLRALAGARDELALGGYGGEWQAAMLRARAHARLSQLDSAVSEGRAAVAAVERVRGNFGSRFFRASFALDKAAPYADLVEILLRLGRTDEAFEVADQARSHALLEHLSATRTETELSRATIRSLATGEALLRRIDTLASRLDVLEERPPQERDDAERRQARDLAGELVQARSEYEALLVKLGERDALGMTLLGGRPTQGEDVRRALRQDEAILEYLITSSRTIAFVVTTDAVRSITTEVSPDDLARRVRLTRDLLGVPGPPSGAVDEVLTGLHALLVAPVERAGLLRNVKRLILIPHSVLSYLPFAALRREGSGRHLVEDYAILHLPSAAALAALRGASVAGVPIPAARSAFAPFPATLPGSLREVRTVGRAIGARTHRGSEANEVAVRQALGAGGVVHLATHGVMNWRNPMFSRIELAAGRGGPGDDGRLEIHELLAIRINAQLVFLSGCETGAGIAWSNQFARGEDYSTLAQSFLFAGARTVAATLWPIEDQGAAVLAERFYTYLDRYPPAEALAEAQRELMSDARYGNPYYWAGYQVIGAGQPVPGAHKPSVVSVQRK